MNYQYMDHQYVLQHKALGEWEDDMDHDPFVSYWDAVIAAMKDSEEFAVPMRVLKRYVEQEVFAIDDRRVSYE